MNETMSLPWLWDGTLRQISIVNDLRLGRLQTGAMDLAGDALVVLELSSNAIRQVVGHAGPCWGALVSAALIFILFLVFAHRCFSFAGRAG
jgi:hypothetical protein